MKVLLSWLRELCPVPLSAEEVADRLTRQGVEVEGIIRPWERLSGVVVARVLDVQDHPKADRLCVATVDAGGSQRQVVVGVRNMGPGDLVPYAPPGARLPGVEFTLERRPIRGVESEGMLCSPKELGISPDGERILVLPDGAGVGEDLRDALGLDDAVIDVAVFPNRPDLLSVVGVAREVAAATGGDLALPDTGVAEGEEKAADVATVEIRDRERCPRYLARVIRGVAPGPSPLQAQIRLGAAGMRPLSNVVDATNYVMLEMGQPLHPFDLPSLSGPGIVVRLASKGERLLTLDDVERDLTEDDLLIADLERGVAIAGVMGSAVAEVGDRTSEVLLESAYFEPRGILRTARRLGLRTEASVRFERGVDPEGVAPAAARAAALIAGWSGGTVLSGEVDVGDVPPRRTVTVRPSRATMLVGTPLSTQEVREALGRLRLPAAEEVADRVAVEVPGFRVDLEREADVIEEVARVRGYDDLPSTLPGIRQAGGLTPEQRLRRFLREALVRGGLYETLSMSFLSAGELEVFDDVRRAAVPLANPLSEEERFLRTSLLPGLFRAARRNAARGSRTVRLFEVGNVFLLSAGEGAAPVEEEHVAALLWGPVGEEWPSERREHDFLDAKGVLEDLARVLAVETELSGQPAGAPYHPGRSSTVVVAGEPVGEVGELHPGVARALDLTGRVALLEVRMAPLVAGARGEVVYRDVSRFPPVRRDLAFVVGREAPAGAVKAALAEAAGDLLDRVALFDVYEGAPLPAEKKSLAFAVDLRAADRTLTDEEADERVRTIAERLAREFGAELRA